MIEREEQFYRRWRWPFDMAVRFLFRPVVLNKGRIPSDGALIVAPNHLDTLDPMCVMTLTQRPIHWAALKRFFDAEDSIFKNNKNHLLCAVTRCLFIRGGFIPIDRGGDNRSSCERIHNYLKTGRAFGVFPEGTTNKQPALVDVQQPHLGFAHFCAEEHATIMPVTITWVPKKKGVRNRVILNCGEPYTIDEVVFCEDTEKSRWMSAIREGMAENQEFIMRNQERHQNEEIC